MDSSSNDSFGNLGASGGSAVPGPIISSSASGGPVFVGGGTKEKKTKKWLVVVILVLVFAVMIVGGYFLITGIEKKDNTVTKEFKEIVNYIENVPQDYIWDEDEKVATEQKRLIYAVLVSNNSMKTIQEYYKGLDDRYASFSDKNRMKVSDELLQNYSNALRILENAINHRLKQSELLDRYDKDGIDEAKKYFDEELKCTSDNDELDMICQSEMEYYELVLNEYAKNPEGYEENDDIGFYFRTFSGWAAKSVLSTSMKKVNANFLEKLNA